ncbi:thioredoxin family protein [Mycobacterium sp. 236(2023)]|uniref:TlpA family protein disulfide reductase n=1 Tax=Mycobacterium sp. 236(2023) TaxID=3038163 RepID=UPI0024156C92|nr:thioredoxin family protein [Mycobacterium sp. 236(2023)]MDG4665555.1 thioredoxin family protein [Mycobacterium sp. 236(2023)]
MSTSWIVVIAVLIAAFGLAFVIGRLITSRSGRIEDSAERPALDGADADNLGLSRTGPTLLHFSAVWCGPCAGVRRVVDQVCADLPAVAHVEIDMDANPEAARKLSVLSLPTTFIFDAEGRQRYRASGVPTAADLRSALQTLLA